MMIGACGCSWLNGRQHSFCAKHSGLGVAGPAGPRRYVPEPTVDAYLAGLERDVAGGVPGAVEQLLERRA